MTRSDRQVLIAKEKDEITGFIAGQIIECFLPVSSVKKIGYISAAYVKPDFRGRRIMRKLLNELGKWFKAQAVSYIELHTLTKNSDSKSAWENLGFETFREQMRKPL